MGNAWIEIEILHLKTPITCGISVHLTIYSLLKPWKDVKETCDAVECSCPHSRWPPSAHSPKSKKKKRNHCEKRNARTFTPSSKHTSIKHDTTKELTIIKKNPIVIFMSSHLNDVKHKHFVIEIGYNLKSKNFLFTWIFDQQPVECT